MGAIKFNGRIMEEPKEIKDAAVEYFMNNFTEERYCRPCLGGVFPRRISSDANTQMEK